MECLSDECSPVPDHNTTNIYLLPEQYRELGVVVHRHCLPIFCHGISRVFGVIGGQWVPSHGAGFIISNIYTIRVIIGIVWYLPKFECILFLCLSVIQSGFVLRTTS